MSTDLVSGDWEAFQPPTFVVRYSKPRVSPLYVARACRMRQIIQYTSGLGNAIAVPLLA